MLGKMRSCATGERSNMVIRTVVLKKFNYTGKTVSGRKFIPHSQSLLTVSIRIYFSQSQSRENVPVHMYIPHSQSKENVSVRMYIPND